MKYSFKDILERDMYLDCRVMVVTGPYNLFNNIVIDELRSMCQGDKSMSMDTELLKEFGMADDGPEIQISNTVDFDTFRHVVAMPSVNGKWFANVDLTTLSRKQRDWLNEYVKAPSEFGILSVFANDFKDYRKILTNRLFNTSKYAHVVQLSFPTRDALKYIVSKVFYQHNATIEDEAMELFITRMSSSYDDYDRVVDKICSEALPEGYMQMDRSKVPTLTYRQVFDSLKGIENFVLTDFVERLTHPLPSDMPRSSLVYKMLGYLVEEYGPEKLVYSLLKTIDTMISFRLAINQGLIPILVHYNVSESKQMMGEDWAIAKMSDFQFRKNAAIASKTSLTDWVYMKMILSNIEYKYSKGSYERALYSLVVRSTLNESRLDNDIGISSILYDMGYPRDIMETV